jgi:hypothetical protein
MGEDHEVEQLTRRRTKVGAPTGGTVGRTRLRVVPRRGEGDGGTRDLRCAGFSLYHEEPFTKAPCSTTAVPNASATSRGFVASGHKKSRKEHTPPLTLLGEVCLRGSVHSRNVPLLNVPTRRITRGVGRWSVHHTASRGVGTDTRKYGQRAERLIAPASHRRHTCANRHNTTLPCPCVQ